MFRMSINTFERPTKRNKIHTTSIHLYIIKIDRRTCTSLNWVINNSVLSCYLTKVDQSLSGLNNLTDFSKQNINQITGVTDDMFKSDILYGFSVKRMIYINDNVLRAHLQALWVNISDVAVQENTFSHGRRHISLFGAIHVTPAWFNTKRGGPCITL